MSIGKSTCWFLLGISLLCGCSGNSDSSKSSKAQETKKQDLPYRIEQTRVFEDGNVTKVRVHAVWEGSFGPEDSPKMLKAIDQIYQLARQEANEKHSGVKTLWVALREPGYPQAVALARSDEEPAASLSLSPKSWLVVPSPGYIERQAWKDLQSEPFVPGGKNKQVIPRAAFELAEPDEPFRIHGVDESLEDGVLTLSAMIISPPQKLERAEAERIIKKLYARLRDYVQDMAAADLQKRVEIGMCPSDGLIGFIVHGETSSGTGTLLPSELQLRWASDPVQDK